MSKNLFLDIVTPVKKIFSGEVQSFSAPGIVGSFQTLFNHAPLLTQISTGEIKLIDESGKITFYATSGGFVEVNKNKIILLADSAECSNEINIQRALQSKQRAEERIKNKNSELNLIRAQTSLTRALNRLKVSTRK